MLLFLGLLVALGTASQQGVAFGGEHAALILIGAVAVGVVAAVFAFFRWLLS
jgi:hypothetical protein